MLKRTWGENMIGNAGIHVVFGIGVRAAGALAFGGLIAATASIAFAGA